MYKAMIVDDEPWVLSGMKGLIRWEDYGYRVACDTDNPQAAPRLLRVNKPDVLFTDVNMPEITGLELAEQACEALPGIQVVFFSAYDDYQYMRSALTLKAFDYLLKPVKPQTLIELLGRLSRRIEACRDSEDELAALRLAHELYAGERVSGGGQSLPGPEPHNGCEALISEIMGDMRGNYARKLSLADYAVKHSIGYCYLSQMFSKYANQTFQAYLTALRLSRAKELIRETGLPLTEIAERVGYSDYFYFSRMFKKHVGKAPTELRD